MFFAVSQLFGWVMFDLMGKIFFRIKVFGLDNLRKVKPGNVIFAANHEGAVDPLLIGGALPWFYLGKMRSFRFMTYYRYITHRFYGWFVWLCGGYSVYPGQNSIKETTKRTVKILKNNHDVLIFPTGKRHHEFKAEDARQGIAYVAKKTGATIVPVYISGTHNVGALDFFLLKRKAVLVYGRPFKLDFDFDEENKEECLKAAKFVMEKVKHLEEVLPNLIAKAEREKARPKIIGAKA